MTDMKIFAEMGVEMAERLGCLLDYSPESIARVEDLARRFCERDRKRGLRPETVTRASAVFGAYLGETLLRNGLADRGFAWMGKDREPGIGREGCWFGPVTEVCNRITLGPEHNLVEFCERIARAG